MHMVDAEYPLLCKYATNKATVEADAGKNCSFCFLDVAKSLNLSKKRL